MILVVCMIIKSTPRIKINRTINEWILKRDTLYVDIIVYQGKYCILEVSLSTIFRMALYPTMMNIIPRFLMTCESLNAAYQPKRAGLRAKNTNYFFQFEPVYGNIVFVLNFDSTILV